MNLEDINNAVGDLDYKKLYKMAAERRGITVEQLKAEMDAAIKEAWDEETKQFKAIPKFDAFVDVVIAHEILTGSSEDDND